MVQKMVLDFEMEQKNHITLEKQGLYGGGICRT
jgi:hypothetical protein